VSRQKDYGQWLILFPQGFLQIQTVQPWKLQIGDYATWITGRMAAVLKQLFGRTEQLYAKSV